MPSLHLVPERRDNVIRNNMVMGTVKEANGKVLTDGVNPASFAIADPQNIVEGNVAAGSERFGFSYAGLPCNRAFSGTFANNVAHSSLVGLWLKASAASASVGCTVLSNFTAYMNWDYGVIR